MMIRKLSELIIPTLIIIAVFVIPTFQISYDPNTILSASTFVFSILTGFFLTDATANYRNLKEVILTENASLSQLYYIVEREAPRKAGEIADVIDDYMIEQLDYELLDHHEGTKDEFEKVISFSSKIEETDRTLTTLISGRQKIFLFAKKSVTHDRWLMLFSLVFVIVFLLLSKRTGDPSLTLMIGVLIASIQQALKLLYDLDSNKYLAGQLGYRTPQDVFRSIGRLPYYPETALEEGIIEPEKPYRVGVYRNYPESFEKTIKTVE